jgi:crotonobetainyl-CoA:carnitine CoA-transferase CaiB-like acyl-CoA transferase
LRGGAERRRKLVAVAISPFGLQGPRRDFNGSDLILQAAGGMLLLNGDEDRPPVRISEETAWAQAGSQAAFAAIAALYSAQRDGVGESIEESAQEAIVDALTNAIPWAQHAGQTKRRKTHPGYTEISIPSIWPCKDGFVCFRVSLGKGGGFRTRRLVGWMVEEGLDEGLADVRWEAISTLTLKQEEADSYVARIERFLRTKTRAELYEEARRRQIILFPVMELSDIPGDAQMAARGFFVSLADPNGRRVRFPGAFFSAGGPEKVGPSPSSPPRPAQHSAAVLAELAGVDQAGFEKLRREGVVA